MSGHYIPRVGDRVRRRDWSDSEAVIVTAVGEQVFLGRQPISRHENAFLYGPGIFSWIKVEPPVVYPEQWINVYPWLPVGRDLVGSYLSRDLADQNAGSRRIAVIHLATDGTVTLHPTTGGAS